MSTLSATSTGTSLLLIVGVIRPLARAIVEPGARAAGWEPAHPCIQRDYSDWWRAGGATNDADHVRLQQRIRADLLADLAHHPCQAVSTIVVAALAPMTAMLEIGAVLRSRGYRLVVLDHHREADTWIWPMIASAATAVTAETSWLPAQPSVPSASTQRLAILVSISGMVVISEVNNALGTMPPLYLHIRVPDPHRGRVKSPEQAARLVQDIVAALTQVRGLCPAHGGIDLFLAVPASVALLLGYHLQDGFGRNICIYENASGGVTRQYVPGGIFGATAPSPSHRTSPDDSVCTDFQGNIDAALAGLRARLPTTTMRGWMHAMIPPAMLPDQALASLPRHEFQWFETLSPATIHHLSASISEEVAEFAFDPQAETVRFHPRLAQAIARGFPASAPATSQALQVREHGDAPNRIIYLQLFILHEWAHIAQNLDGTLATAAGQFPKALEELDWLADTFALVAHVGGQGSSLLQAAQRTVRIMLQGMVSFQTEPEDPAARFMELRRLNRYLIWLVQHCRLTALAARGTEQAIWEILGSMPVVDLRGLPPLIRSERVVVDLERGSHATDLALGIALQGRFVRIGHEHTIDLRACLRHVRRHEVDEAIGALAGLHAILRPNTVQRQ